MSVAPSSPPCLANISKQFLSVTKVNDQIIAAMEREYVYPDMANRDSPITWAEKGHADICQTANRRTKEILADYHPQYLAPEADLQIRDRFGIFLS